MRKIKIETEKFYHIFNRGAGKQEIFCNENDYVKFLSGFVEFNNNSTYEQRQYIRNKNKEPGSCEESLRDFINTLPKLVNIICYCLLPNHYHFILKQLTDDGIKIFLHKLGTSYANYFNAKYKRSGVFFERPFEAFPINKEEKLCWLSAYVNCNYEIHKLGKSEFWDWSSCKDYFNIRKGELCSKKAVQSQFNGVIEYKEYCKAVIAEAQDIKKAKKYLT